MGHKEGAAKAAAKRIGVSVEEYLAHKNNRFPSGALNAPLGNL